VSARPEPASGSPDSPSGRPWRSGLTLVALGALVALSGLMLSVAIARWLGAERAPAEVVGRAAGYPVGLLGFFVAAQGVHRILWWRPYSVAPWLRYVLSALTTAVVGAAVGAVVLGIVAVVSRAW